MKFLHSADIHLDSPLRGLSRYEGAPLDALRGATRLALTSLVDLALAEEVAFVLIVGDLFDGSWRDYSTALFFASEMSRLRAASIDVFIVRGNHDAQTQSLARAIRWPTNVRELSSAKAETVILENIGVAIHGQSFPNRVVEDDLSIKYPSPIGGAFNIGMLHTSADGREGHARYAPCSPSALVNKGYNYWALGHVHAREELHREPWIVFPGNLQGRHARETGPKGATLVTVESGRAVAVTHRVVDAVRWDELTIDAAGAMTTDDLVERAAEAFAVRAREAEGRVVACRVTVSGRTQIHAALERASERFENELRIAANDVGSLWIEKVVLRTTNDARRHEPRDGASPIDELALRLESSADDDALLLELVDELKELRQKLPDELRHGDEMLALSDPQGLKEWTRAATTMLLSRLSGGDETR